MKKSKGSIRKRRFDGGGEAYVPDWAKDTDLSPEALTRLAAAQRAATSVRRVAAPVTPATSNSATSTATQTPVAPPAVTPKAKPKPKPKPLTDLEKLERATPEQRAAARRLHPEWFREGGKYYKAPPTIGELATSVGDYFRKNTARLKQEKQERIKREAAKMGSLGMKKGGKVSSASKRADGCAIRGKTRAR